MFNPFQDDEGNIQFPLEPTLDRVFLYPSSSPEKFQETGLIIIPQQFQEFYRKGIGIVLAAGPGYYDKKGSWHPISPQLKIGSKVLYDVTVPWEHAVRGLDGKNYILVLCGNSDIYGVLED